MADTQDKQQQHPDAAPAQVTDADKPSYPIPAPIAVTEKVILRPYSAGDTLALSREAANPRVARYMRNLFPNPYRYADAEAWIAIASAREPIRNFAIYARAPEPALSIYAGGIGLKPLGDVEARSMEIGYWLGETHWGCGLASEAVAAFSRWAFENVPDLRRLEAGVFEGNTASTRVLEKAGYVFEGRQRKAGWKEDLGYFDILMYGLLKEECLGQAEQLAKQ